MARFLPWTRKQQPVQEAAAAAPATVDRTGFVYGVPVGGTTPYNQGVTSANSQDRRSQLTQLFEAYMTCPWSSACVDVVARTITAGGIDVEWAGDDEDQDAPDAPAEVLELRALLDYVNPSMDVRQLLIGVLTDLEIFGDAFLEVVYFLGRPIALYPLDVPSMAVISDEHGMVTAYVQATEFGQKAEFTPDEVIHFTLGSPRAGITGISPTSKALLPITVWLFTAATLKEQMRKGDPAQIWADHPTEISDQDVQRWRDKYAVQNLGPRNIGTPITTRGGATVKELSTKKVENYLKTLDQKRDEIVSTYGVPPHQVGIIESGNLGGGTGTVQFKNYLVNKCDPLGQIVLEKLNFHLAVKAFGLDPSQWQLRFGSMDWRDDKVIDEIGSQRLRDGRWTLNRARAEIGELPVDGGDAPVLVDRQNLVLWSDMDAMSKAIVAKAGSSGTAAPGTPEPAQPVASGEEQESTGKDARAARLLELYRARQRELHKTADAPPVAEKTTPSSPQETLALTEAAEAARTGAYLVLKVAADDAQRLAVDGGEPADALHVTLGFLAKKAAAYSKADKAAIEERLTDALSTVAWPVEADAWARATFNPTSPERDTCQVLLVQSDALARARQAVVDALGDDLSTTFPVWFPHVALAYTDDDVIDDTRMGTIRFDRAVLAWGEKELTLDLGEPEPVEAGPSELERGLGLIAEAIDAAPAPIVNVQVQPAEVQVVPGAPVSVDVQMPAPRATRTTVTRNDDGSMTSVVEPEPDSSSPE